MNETSTPARPNNKRRLGVVLTVVFTVALLMGPGPGVMLVNSPEPLLGFPRIYVWGLFWYAVEVIVVLVAYLFVWTEKDKAAETS